MEEKGRNVDLIAIFHIFLWVSNVFNILLKFTHVDQCSSKVWIPMYEVKLLQVSILITVTKLYRWEGTRQQTPLTFYNTFIQILIQHVDYFPLGSFTLIHWIFPTITRHCARPFYEGKNVYYSDTSIYMTLSSIVT